MTINKERLCELFHTVIARLRKPGRFGFGLFLVLVVVFIWVGSSALIQYVFKDTDYNRPFFLTYFSTGLFTVYLLGFICLPWKWNGTHRGALTKDAMIIKNDKTNAKSSSLAPTKKSALTTNANTALPPDDATITETELESFCGPSDDEAIRTMAVIPENIPLLTMRDTTTSTTLAANGGSNVVANDDDDNDDDNDPPEPPLTTKQVARFALLFAPLWFIANLTFNWSLSLTSVSSTTIISSSSGLFTLILGVLMRLNVFRWVKLLGILLTVGGVLCVALFDSSGSDHKETVEGDIVCLVSAMAYAVYVNVLQRGIGDDSRVSMAMFFGFVGLWNLLLMWPFFFILHWTGLETFALPPSAVLGYLFLNGFIGTVLSDWLWLQSMLLTSPLVSTLGLSLTIPFALFFDLFIEHTKFQIAYLAGSALTLAGFIVTTLAENKTHKEAKNLRRQTLAQQPAAATTPTRGSRTVPTPHA
jgi:solute carrier family 35 protein F5